MNHEGWSHPVFQPHSPLPVYADVFIRESPLVHFSANICDHELVLRRGFGVLYTLKCCVKVTVRPCYHKQPLDLDDVPSLALQVYSIYARIQCHFGTSTRLGEG